MAGLMRTEVRLDSRIPGIIAAAEAGVSVAVKRCCERIETGAKARSRVDTGAMRAGWQHQMTGEKEGIVFNLVEYTVYNEFGTIFMSAQPMLQPAIEEAKEPFVKDLAAAYEGRSIA